MIKIRKLCVAWVLETICDLIRPRGFDATLVLILMGSMSFGIAFASWSGIDLNKLNYTVRL